MVVIPKGLKIPLVNRLYALHVLPSPNKPPDHTYAPGCFLTYDNMVTPTSIHFPHTLIRTSHFYTYISQLQGLQNGKTETFFTM